jgi:hypothetical protein
LLAVAIVAGAPAARADEAGPAEQLARVLLAPGVGREAKGMACERLKELGAAAAPAVPALMLQLRNGDQILRDYAITTLGQIGPAATAALPALRAVVHNDPSVENRQSAADAVRRIERKPAKPENAPEPLRTEPPVNAQPRPVAAGLPLPSGKDGGKLPASYSVLSSQGEAWLVATHQRGGAALAALRETVRGLAQYFDQPPRVTGGFAGRTDQQAQIVFETRLQDMPTLGVALAAVAEGQREAGVCVIFGKPEAVRGGFAELQRKAVALLARPPTRAGEPAPWRSERIPDGSGTLRLAEGWRIASASKAMVTVRGPGNQEVMLGIWMPVHTPDAERSFNEQQAGLGLLPRGSGALVAAMATPAKAIQDLMPQLSRLAANSGAPAISNITILEEKPAPSLTGSSAFVLWDCDRTSGGTAARWRALSQATLGAVGPGQWVFYVSQAAAPRDSFEKDLPVMVQIWSSWRIEDRVLQERLAAAAKSQQRTTEVIRETHDNLDQARTRALADWAEVIRGYRTAEDTRTGERTQVDLGWSREIVEHLNEQAGSEIYREVPLRDDYWAP